MTKALFSYTIKNSTKKPTVFNVAHQTEYELKITEQCSITQKVVSVKYQFVDVCGREVIVIDGCIYRYNNYFVYKINYICIY